MFHLDDTSQYITTLAFSRDGKILSVADNKGNCFLFDVTCLTGEIASRMIMSPDDTTAFITRMSWNSHNNLAIAYSNGHIRLYTIENLKSRRFLPYGVLKGHTGRILGLDWDPTDIYQRTLASGGEDTLVVIWDTVSFQSKHILREHESAVRALAFCPWQRNTLATGTYIHHKSDIIYVKVVA